jgi:hypothetical protein
MGPAKLERYGEEILAVIATAAEGATDGASRSAPDGS